MNQSTQGPGRLRRLRAAPGRPGPRRGTPRRRTSAPRPPRLVTATTPASPAASSTRTTCPPSPDSPTPQKPPGAIDRCGGRPPRRRGRESPPPVTVSQCDGGASIPSKTSLRTTASAAPISNAESPRCHPQSDAQRAKPRQGGPPLGPDRPGLNLGLARDRKRPAAGPPAEHLLAKAPHRGPGVPLGSRRGPTHSWIFAGPARHHPTPAGPGLFYHAGRTRRSQ